MVGGEWIKMGVGELCSFSMGLHDPSSSLSTSEGAEARVRSAFALQRRKQTQRFRSPFLHS